MFARLKKKSKLQTFFHFSFNFFLDPTVCVYYVRQVMEVLPGSLKKFQTLCGACLLISTLTVTGGQDLRLGSL